MQANVPISNITQVATRSHHDLQDLTTYDDHTQYVPTDGSRAAKNLQSGLDASKPASPSVGDVYSATDTKLTYNCYTAGTWTTAALRATSDSFTASESISAGAAVAMGDGVTDVTVSNTTTNSTYYANNNSNIWIAQTFVAASGAAVINGIIFEASFGGSFNTVNAAIYATSGGAPTGSPLGGQTASVSSSSSITTTYTLTFPTPVSVTAGTTYAMVLWQNTVGNSVIYSYNTSQSYAGGEVYYGGTGGTPTWGTGNAQSWYFTINEASTVAGQACNANATSTNSRFNNFLGFASASVTAGNSVTVNMVGVDNNQTGLTVNDSYYLTNTNGVISTSAGTNSKKVGIAVTSTMIAIQNTI